MMTPEQEDEMRKRDQRIKDSARAQAAEHLMKIAAIPMRYRGVELAKVSSPPKKAAIAAKLMELIEKPKTLALVGDYGTGKTHLACGAAIHFCRHGRSAMYRKAYDLFLDIKSTFTAASKETQRDVERRYFHPDLLILDESHNGSDSPFEDTVLRNLVDTRHAEAKSTILIANATKEDFVTYLGKAITRRINDAGGFVTCDWGMYRHSAQGE